MFVVCHVFLFRRVFSLCLSIFFGVLGVMGRGRPGKTIELPNHEEGGLEGNLSMNLINMIEHCGIV